MNRIYTILCAVLLLVSCQYNRVSDDPTLRLVFEQDTVCFDTVFTDLGSATQTVMIYNPNANALRISRIWQATEDSPFRVNIDGESKAEKWEDIILPGGDSLYAFVMVHINPNKQNQPVLIEDSVYFAVNGHIQTLHLEAVGQDVVRIKSRKRLTVYNDKTFTAEKPYLIYDTIAVQGTLTMEPGAKLYFHDKAMLYAYGDVHANGCLASPIILQGDRIDRLFDSVPYSYVAGMWSGIYFVKTEEAGITNKEWLLNYVEIRSAQIGLYCYNDDPNHKPHLTLTNSVIHNHSLYGLVLENVDALVANSEISNAAAYCVYLEGGEQQFIHSTIASYFNYTNVRIQSVSREDVAAVYIDNLNKEHADTKASFINCIIDGVRENNMVVATPLPQYYAFPIYGNYLKADSLLVLGARDNIYRQADDTLSVFVNDYYKYKEYKYYNFQLDSLSPARGIGDSLAAIAYPFDRLGRSRAHCRPDAGCYQYP